MFNRLSQLNRDTIPLHHEETLWLVRFINDLVHLGLHGLPLRADQSKLEEWSDIRTKLNNCTEPLIEYGSNYWNKFSEQPEHINLIMAVDLLTVELKLHNLGLGQREITLNEVDQIRDMLPELDKCRKRVVFYR